MVSVDRLKSFPGLKVVREAPIIQMVTEGEGAALSAIEPPVVLGPGDVPEMLRLAERTNPGPFGPRTHELGQYVGVEVGGALAAMAGERMRLDGCVEISAACVSPDHRGKGYGRFSFCGSSASFARRAPRRSCSLHGQRLGRRPLSAAWI